MKKIFSLFILLLLLSSACLAQNKEQGYCKVSRAKKNKQLQPGKAKLIIQFVGPTGKPVTNQIKFALNKDSIVPVIDETGVYSMQVNAAKYKLNFIAPWWYNVATDSIQFKSRRTRILKVQFEAKEIQLMQY